MRNPQIAIRQHVLSTCTPQSRKGFSGKQPLCIPLNLLILASQITYPLFQDIFSILGTCKLHDLNRCLLNQNQ